MHLPASKDGTSLDTRKVDATTPASPSTAREKPQKVLPCPRCESMNTKFCYYNNYSVNQPRHFCRQCQRYWTVGGTLRNVPVGGGSRKKNRHQRNSEPYLRTGTTIAATTTGGPLALATPTFHDMQGFNFSQLPGFNPFGAAYPTMQPDHQAMVPGMYINPPISKPGDFQPMYAQAGASFYPNLGQPQPETHVKPEFWTNHQVWEQTTPKQADQVGAKTANESSMLLHMGLNSRPHGKPASWNMNNQVTGTSPPHGSSTIEEEGSTPTNGYSNSGYEEGDTVSSMWQEMQEMQDIFQ